MPGEGTGATVASLETIGSGLDSTVELKPHAIRVNAAKASPAGRASEQTVIGPNKLIGIGPRPP